MRFTHEVILISRLFRRLVDEMPVELRDELLDRDPINRGLPFLEEDRSRSVVARMLAESPVEVLLSFYEDLFEEEWRTPHPELLEGAWEEGRLRLFMSHNSSTKIYVKSVAEALEEYGIHGFVAHEDIKPLAFWEGEIERALKECQACTAFLSEDFHTSLWTDQEVGYCFARDIPIIPVRMGMDPYGFMGKFQALTAGESPQELIANQIFHILRNDERVKDLVESSVLYNFINSKSFVEAKDRWRLVKDFIDHWTVERRYMLEVSYARNSQIAGAHFRNLPAAIDAFLKDLPPLQEM